MNSKQFHSVWYFVLGSSQKSSLCSHFSRQNDFIHYNQPKVQFLKVDIQKHCFIQGSIQLFKQIQQIKPNLNVILIGKPQSSTQKQICEQYEKIGKFKYCTDYKYQQFRRKINPNLFFVYGPDKKQNRQVSETLAKNIGYVFQQLRNDPNYYISTLDKTNNYVINGLFEDPNSIKILLQYFQIKVIHIKYSRVDLPNMGSYFDKQFQVANYLKDKNFYVKVEGKYQNINFITSQISKCICPKLLYVNNKNSNNNKYLKSYLQQTHGLLINIDQISSILKRKKLAIPENSLSQISFISSVFYKDLNRKQIVLSDFPQKLNQVLQLQKLNRRIQLFIDISDRSKYQFTKQFTTQMYFLQSQKYFVPNLNNSLRNQLEPKFQYWIINGCSGSGKTSIAKFLSAEYGLKLIQFEPYIQSVKQKLSPNQQGVVAIKNIIEHFKQLFKNNNNSSYIIDGFPYTNKELQQWIQAIGEPKVINLQVQLNEQIKRSRRKAQADINAQVTQQQSNKAKQSAEKSRVWLQKLKQYCPHIHLHTIDYNKPQIQVEDNIKNLIKPRIYLIQKNNSFIFQNLALKHSLGFINLNKVRLRECPQQVKNINKRDIILCNHGHQKARIASQDLYWIQKNLGQIRYVCVWGNESKEDQQKIMKLQRPPQPQKPKLAEGQQKPPEEAVPEGEAAQKKFDIYDYQWSSVEDYKNLSQWFFKSKRSISQFQSTPEQCYNKFKRVLDNLNQSSDNNVYEKIK